MNSFGYEYFCGANVSISFNGVPNTEVAGISYEALDSSTPIYGYSSRLFDAVAPGQKLIRGSFVLNFKSYASFVNQVLSTKLGVKGSREKLEAIDYTGETSGKMGMDQAYTFHSTYIKENFEGVDENGASTNEIDPNKYNKYMDYLARVAFSDTHSPHDGLALAEMLHEDYGYDSNFINQSKSYLVSSMDATMIGPFNIEISFGGGSNKFTIVSCYVNNFGSSIQISEDVILQEFSFFGRNIIH